MNSPHSSTIKTYSVKLLICSFMLCSSFALSHHAYADNDLNQKANSLLNGHPTEPYTSFLKKDQVANSLTILPPPPSYNSVQFLADKAAYEEGHSLINTPRWKTAINDANLSDANIGHPFSEAIGIDISKKNTPITYHLLRKILVDAGFYGTDIAKNHYNRVRPFVFFKNSSCTPQDEKFLKYDGSYPSGHSAFGWASALVLAELEPQKQDAILKRGYEFGQSRVICGAHWQSDVDAGRIIGAEVFARLHTNKEFNDEFNKAKTELNEKLKQHASKP